MKIEKEENILYYFFEIESTFILDTKILKVHF